MLQTEIHHPANDERSKIGVYVKCWVYEFVQEVQSVENALVGHQRQVNQFLNFPVTKLRPDPIVLADYFVAGRVQRPIGSAASQVFNRYFNSAVAPIQDYV